MGEGFFFTNTTNTTNTRKKDTTLQKTARPPAFAFENVFMSLLTYDLW